MKTEWKQVKLGDYADFSNGINFGKDYYSKGIKLITVSDFKDRLNPNYDTLVEVDSSVVRESDLLRNDDIVFVRSNGNKELVGRCMIIKNLQTKLTYSGFCIRARFNNFENASPSYFVYYFKSPLFRKSIANSSVGANIQNLNQEILSSHKVALPPLKIQQKIANILSCYDEAIENNNKRIKLLEQMAQNLYKEWFVRFRFPGWQNAEFENGIPKGWKIEKLGNLANISTGKCNREDAEEEGIYPLFDRSQEIKLSNDWIKDCEAIIVPGEGTSFIPRYYVGKFNLHQRCYCVEPKKEKTGKFLFYTLMMNRGYFLSVATGATVPSLRYNNFSMMKFIMPDLKLCQKFDDLVTKCFMQMDVLKNANQNLAKQRDLLLPRLMSGKLEVK